ncbi:mandelate racemase/muconate lactonizing enzyme family protein [Oceanobacillus halotolerans]|uniref:mandelate racemase/muconate lactonizing enzyme family protein n=1 Tax=Oceanobacillus halotolerans TaxID=2663380 RepID=UPI001CF7699B|nr:mandelate racemase/muconate lactonizing enzyme family protein [Oceanobacillus halotolerans]
MAQLAKNAVLEGYKDIKMKLGIDPKKDVERVTVVREAVGNQIRIRADVNQGWGTVQLAREMLKQLEPYHLVWVEQPIAQSDRSMFCQLQNGSSIPLMADESFVTIQDLRTFGEQQSIDYLNIKLMKCGGIYPSYQFANQAALFGIQCQIGSMVESNIASAAGFHVALASENVVSTEISGPTKFSVDVGNLTYNLPFVHLEDKPGLGIDIDETVLMDISEKVEEIFEGN